MKKDSQKSCCHTSGPAAGEMLLRIGLGVMIGFSGFGKLMGGTAGFVGMFGDKFADSWMPMFIITPILWIIPAAELLIGLWLLSGVKRVGALMSFGILMILFVIGHKLMGDSNLTSIFVYLIATSGTLFLTSHSCRAAS